MISRCGSSTPFPPAHRILEISHLRFFMRSAGSPFRDRRTRPPRRSYSPSLEQCEARMALAAAFSAGTSIQLVPQAAAANPPGIGFGESALAGASLSSPTSLQFGSDGKLYVAQQDGVIKVYTVTRNA